MDRLTTVFSIEQGPLIRLPCLVTAGQAVPKTGKALCCFNSGQPAHHVPWALATQAHWFCSMNPSLYALSALLLAQVPLGCVGVLSSTYQMGPGDSLHSSWGYVSVPLPGRGGGILQATFNFPNMLSSWEGLGLTLGLGNQLITLSVYIKEASMPSDGFALGNQFCPHTSQLKRH